jgi:hypothetical protein
MVLTATQPYRRCKADGCGVKVLRGNEKGVMLFFLKKKSPGISPGL